MAAETGIELPPAGTIPPIPTAEEFADKVAVVTGGSDGLGKHLTASLVAMGADVFFCGRREALGNQVAGELGEKAHFIQCDLAEVDQTRAFIQSAGEFKGRIDYLVNNAAVDPVAPFEQFDPDWLDTVYAINLRSQLVACRAALEFLRAGEGKAIVNVSTTNYLFGWPGATTYNATKAGILGFSRSLARELGKDGIRVNVVSPGWIMTPRQLEEKVDESSMRDLVATQCVKSLITEQHVTPLTLFLLSQASGGLSGQDIVVDGGKYLH